MDIEGMGGCYAEGPGEIQTLYSYSIFPGWITCTDIILYVYMQTKNEDWIPFFSTQHEISYGKGPGPEHVCHFQHATLV